VSPKLPLLLDVAVVEILNFKKQIPNNKQIPITNNQIPNTNPNNQISKTTPLPSTGSSPERVGGSRSGPNSRQYKPEPPSLSRTDCFGHWKLKFEIFLRFGAWDLLFNTLDLNKQ
jgi:hypothetical protein